MNISISCIFQFHVVTYVATDNFIIMPFPFAIHPLSCHGLYGSFQIQPTNVARMNLHCLPIFLILIF